MRSLLVALSLLLLAECKGRTDSNKLVKYCFLSTESIQRSPFVAIRGGATIAEDEEDSDDEDSDEEDGDEGELDPSLAKSAMTSTTKVQAKKATAVKEAVSAKLKKPRKQTGGLLKVLKVPYFVRACMNPFTVVAMTKAYFSSLFNLNYLKEEDSSQTLRTAMEEKAKKSGGTGGRKGKRQMKPGQAKTLSDLPQLSA